MEDHSNPIRERSRAEIITRWTIGIGAAITTSVMVAQRLRPHLNANKFIQRCSLPHVRPRKEHEELFRDLCTRLKVSPSGIKLRVSQNVGSECVGAPTVPEGAALLLTRNSTWTTRKDASAAGFTFEGRPLNLKSSLDRQLVDNMLLSENVVKFMLAHELIHIRDMDFVTEGFHDAAHVLGAYTIGLLIAPYSVGLIPAVAAQVLVWAVVAGVFKNNVMLLSRWMEFKADRCAAELGVDMCEAGIEWCHNKFETNKALVELNPETGSLLYTPEGDLVDTSTHPSLRQRLERIQEVRKRFPS